MPLFWVFLPSIMECNVSVLPNHAVSGRVHMPMDIWSSKTVGNCTSFIAHWSIIWWLVRCRAGHVTGTGSVIMCQDSAVYPTLFLLTGFILLLGT